MSQFCGLVVLWSLIADLGFSHGGERMQKRGERERVGPGVGITKRIGGVLFLFLYTSFFSFLSFFFFFFLFMLYILKKVSDYIDVSV